MNENDLINNMNIDKLLETYSPLGSIRILQK